MPWFKVDDTFAHHAKVMQAGNAAVGLWTRAGAWCAQQLTDGFVPDHVVATLGKKTEAQRLVVVGLWDRAQEGYQFHDWASFQPSRAATEERRDAWRERQRRARRRRDSPPDAEDVSRRDASVSHAGVTQPRHAPVTESRPVPSRPVPTTETSRSSGSSVTRANEAVAELVAATDPDADPVGRAGQVVAAYVAAAVSAGKPQPGPNLRNRVGRQALALLGEGHPSSAVLTAVRHAAEGGWHDIEIQMQRDATTPRPASRQAREQAGTDEFFSRAIARARELDARDLEDIPTAITDGRTSA